MKFWFPYNSSILYSSYFWDRICLSQMEICCPRWYCRSVLLSQAIFIFNPSYGQRIFTLFTIMFHCKKHFLVQDGINIYWLIDYFFSWNSLHRMMLQPTKSVMIHRIQLMLFWSEPLNSIPSACMVLLLVVVFLGSET